MARKECLYKIILPFHPSVSEVDSSSINLDMGIVAKRGLVKIFHKMTKYVDPDEMAHYELSHLDLHCLNW